MIVEFKLRLPIVSRFGRWYRYLNSQAFEFWGGLSKPDPFELSIQVADTPIGRFLAYSLCPNVFWIEWGGNLDDYYDLEDYTEE